MKLYYMTRATDRQPWLILLLFAYKATAHTCDTDISCVCIVFSDDTGRKKQTRVPKTECLQLNSDTIGVYVRFYQLSVRNRFRT